MTVNRFNPLALAVLAMMSTGVKAQEPVRAEWIYLTDNGAWISRAAELRKVETALPLPVDNLAASEFWWQADTPSLSLNWQTPARKGWLSEDTVVQVEEWSGSWTVVQLDPELMVLAQAGERRPLPTSQWHRLSWVVGQNTSAALELTVTQPQDDVSDFRYAWFDSQIAAEVRYSLDLQTETAQLRQQLVLHNQSDYTVAAPGYSYAQSREQGRVMMARDVSVRSESDVEVGAPKAGDSTGQATLVSQEPVVLPEQSHAWLGVQTQALTEVEHQYRFRWNTRLTETVPGDWSVTIQAEKALPAMAGPVQIAVWDREVALLETSYRPQRSNQATLELGPSDLMTLATESLGGGEWLLTLTNRNSQSAEAMLELNHFDDNQQQQTGLALPVPAEGEVEIRVSLRNGQLTARPQ